MFILLFLSAFVFLICSVLVKSSFVILMLITVVLAIVSFIKYIRLSNVRPPLNDTVPEKEALKVEPNPVYHVEKESPKAESKPDETPEKEVIEFHLPKVIDGATVAYQYEEVVFALDCAEDPDPYMAKELHFENDADKIRVAHESVQIGFLKPGKITDMIRDWLNRGDPIRAFLTGYNTDESTGHFIIVFYRDALKHAKRRGAAVKEYKLTGNKSAAAQEECCYASVDDRCTIEYDYNKEKYAVHDETYSLYGYLPAAGAKFFEEHDSNCVAVVSSVELDDEDRKVIYVELYAQ